jgi:hypothetical protein
MEAEIKRPKFDDLAHKAAVGNKAERAQMRATRRE